MNLFKLLFLLFFWITPLFSGENESSIYKAMYLFEMKGEHEEAIKILQKVSETGSPEEKSEADFLLAKIRDLAGNKTSASFYYKQSILESENYAQIYFAAGQLAKQDNAPEKLLKAPILFSYSISQIFYSDTTKILLENRMVYNTVTKTFFDLPKEIPLGAKILDIRNSGILWEDGEHIEFTPLLFVFKNFSFPIKQKLTDFKFLSNTQMGFIDNGVFTFVSGNTIRFKTPPKYKDCQITETPKATYLPILLNCPDNALHFLSKETGLETDVLAMLDPISKVHISKNGILIYSSDALWFFSHTDISTPLWRHSTLSSVEEILSLHKYFVVLEASGFLTLLSKKTGQIVSAVKTNATSLVALNTGLLGIITRDGALIAKDTLLKPLWMYHLGKAPLFSPWVFGEDLFYPISFDTLKVLNSIHYGKKPLYTQILKNEANTQAYYGNWENVSVLADSILHLEPGNAEARFFKALYTEQIKAPLEERKKAWAEAIKVSTNDFTQKQKILSHYSDIIGANFVVPLDLSPKTVYPKLYSYKNYLYLLDPASRQILLIDSETGKKRTEIKLEKIENSSVTAAKDNLFAVASGFSLKILNLDVPEKFKRLEMPGKIFQLYFSEEALFVSTWNGFIVKILLNNLQQAWSRKVESEAFFISILGNEIVTTSLSGKIEHLFNMSGQIKQMKQNLQSEISQVISGDSSIGYITNDRRILLYNGHGNSFLSLSFEKIPVFGRFVSVNGKPHLLLYFEDNEIALYSLPHGKRIWNYQAKFSAFNEFVLQTKSFWIDQNEELLELSLDSGKVLRKLSIYGGTGAPFILNHTLYTITPQKLLYSFSLK